MIPNQQVWPYKFYCIVAFGEGVPGVEYGDKVIIYLSEFSSHFKIQSSRLRAHIEDAQDLGLIDNLTMVRGIATFKLLHPTHCSH